jgi:hypothetical protein
MYLFLEAMSRMLLLSSYANGQPRGREEEEEKWMDSREGRNQIKINGPF